MLRAHSLLYAVYVCLIVSILCAALLYFSNLYGQLNGYYNLRESLFGHNLSVVNFALGHQLQNEEIPEDTNTGIGSSYQAKSFGVLNVLICHSYISSDTVSSALFTGCYHQTKTALHLSNFSKPLSYFGKVSITGDNFLPSAMIEPVHVNNIDNQLSVNGGCKVSDRFLPEIRQTFSKIYQTATQGRLALSELEPVCDSVYFNSFLNETQTIEMKPILSGLTFKGNFILWAKDSLYIKKNVVLEDVILMAPKIVFEEGFQGSTQAFATKIIEVGSNTNFNYPSILCIYNSSREKAKIDIKAKSRIAGAVVLCGNPLTSIAENTIAFARDGLMLGTIYCSGQLSLESNVHGSVYTNKFFLKKESSSYENVISDIEINPFKLPDYFIGLPLFETKKQPYGIIKKVL